MTTTLELFALQGVRQLLEGSLDSAYYLTSWAHRLGLDDLLREATGD